MLCLRSKQSAVRWDRWVNNTSKKMLFTGEPLPEPRSENTGRARRNDGHTSQCERSTGQTDPSVVIASVHGISRRKAVYPLHLGTRYRRTCNGQPSHLLCPL